PEGADRRSDRHAATDTAGAALAIMNDDVRDQVLLLIEIIRRTDEEMKRIRVLRPALDELINLSSDPENDDGIAGHAWRLDGAIDGGGWSDIVRNAAELQEAFS